MSFHSLRACFAEQARLHPAMQPRDALKLAYQAAFGAEHLLHDGSRARRLLEAELAGCAPNAALPLREDIAPGVCRLNLASCKAAGLPAQQLAEMFLLSCKPHPEGASRFREALWALDALTGAGQMPFSASAWQQEKQAYLHEGVRPVHHSQAYREAEAPAYRVVDARFARPLPLLLPVGQAEGPKVIALDGRCASGKTTLAEDLHRIAGASVIHMDDFFLPAALRTEERLSPPGGNVHYERFRADVLPRLKSGRDFTYKRFDCSRMALDGLRHVPAASLYVVEGAYSCHPALGDYMTLRAFSNIAPREQRRRILARNGKDGWDVFRARWIPLEEAYFAAFRIREKADAVL